MELNSKDQQFPQRYVANIKVWFCWRTICTQSSKMYWSLTWAFNQNLTSQLFLTRSVFKQDWFVGSIFTPNPCVILIVTLVYSRVQAVPLLALFLEQEVRKWWKIAAIFISLPLNELRERGTALSSRFIALVFLFITLVWYFSGWTYRRRNSKKAQSSLQEFRDWRGELYRM